MKTTKTSKQPTCKFCGTPLKTSTEFCTWHCRRDHYYMTFREDDVEVEDYKIDEFEFID